MPIDFQSLFDALNVVLPDSLENELDIAIKECEYGKNTKGTLLHRFEEWLIYHIKNDKGLGVFQQILSRREMSQLLVELGVDISNELIPNKDLYNKFEKAIGIPDLKIKGRKYYIDKCNDFQNGKPEQIVTEVRQLCERMLREILLVAINSHLSNVIVGALCKIPAPNLPHSWDESKLSNKSYITEKINDDSSGDFGFFSHVISKASKLFEIHDSDRQRINYFNLLRKNERTVLSNLSHALNLYVHFKPSEEKNRDHYFADSLKNLIELVKSLDERKIIPNAAIFLEHSSGLFGTYYRGISEEGSEIALRTDDEIPLMKRILFWEISNPIHRIAGWAVPEW